MPASTWAQHRRSSSIPPGIPITTVCVARSGCQALATCLACIHPFTQSPENPPPHPTLPWAVPLQPKKRSWLGVQRPGGYAAGRPCGLSQRGLGVKGVHRAEGTYRPTSVSAHTCVRAHTHTHRRVNCSTEQWVVSVIWVGRNIQRRMVSSMEKTIPSTHNVLNSLCLANLPFCSELSSFRKPLLIASPPTWAGCSPLPGPVPQPPWPLHWSCVRLCLPTPGL
ncbi:hypothetical protein HJG60_010773 [Phyllostomus discolor]|uniref:Uncharacterized protein n=1 Tax=Phyllostomus discolor TaxID=89673 RepID=A0A834ABV1_9CHIR|nr:hypothetical protein HJG60_010773 [Phyllostomus discolor]